MAQRNILIRRLSSVAALALTPFALTAGVLAQTAPYGQPSTAKGDWPMYFADPTGSRYSPQDQINAANFNTLEVAWHFKTDQLGSRPEYKLEGTPLEINGTVYTTGGSRRDVVALDSKTGELKWVYSLNEGIRAAISPRQLSGRGVSYWSDGKGDDRILYITTGYRLVELNAHTGQLIDGFGEHGMIDMKVGAYKGVPGKPGVYEQIDLVTGEIGLHTTPTVVNDMVIVGSSMKEGFQPTTQNNTKGLVRAWDTRTGKLIWTFHDIPQKGEFGYDSWANGSADYNGNAGVWTGITVDKDLGNVYLPVEDATNDVYGGSRIGNDLFADSLVCVDLQTGKMKWYFQFVHHPIFNYDITSPPLLINVTVGGKPIKAVAVPSKEAWLYVFDRETGKPIWPMIEKPVPQSNTPGEKTSKTQPFPTRPAPYAPQYVQMDNLIDFTPQLHAEALEVLKKFAVGPMFNPAVISKVGGPIKTMSMNNASGGTNWPGGGYDPETQIVYVPAIAAGIVTRGLVAPPEGYSDAKYLEGEAGQPFSIQGGPGFGSAADAPKVSDDNAKLASILAAHPQKAVQPSVRATVEGLPIVKPPYGTLTAIDVNSGDTLWQVAHGDTPDEIRNNPALKGLTIPKTGQAGNVGLLVTKSLVVIGDPQFSTSAGHPRGAMLRAYNKKTGEQVGAVWMPAPQSGSPMTYSYDGKQYIVVAVSGGNYSGDYLAFSLPSGN